VKITLIQIVNWLTWIVAGATVVRIALYRLPDLLTVWIPRNRPFWLTYAKLLESLDVVIGWLSGALAKFGKSDLLMPAHLEFLRDRVPAPPIAVLDKAAEEPAVKEPKNL
jgi:hypothetical protein